MKNILQSITFTLVVVSLVATSHAEPTLVQRYDISNSESLIPSGKLVAGFKSNLESLSAHQPAKSSLSMKDVKANDLCLETFVDKCEKAVREIWSKMYGKKGKFEDDFAEAESYVDKLVFGSQNNRTIKNNFVKALHDKMKNYSHISPRSKKLMTLDEIIKEGSIKLFERKDGENLENVKYARLLCKIVVNIFSQRMMSGLSLKAITNAEQEFINRPQKAVTEANLEKTKIESEIASAPAINIPLEQAKVEDLHTKVSDISTSNEKLSKDDSIKEAVATLSNTAKNDEKVDTPVKLNDNGNIAATGILPPPPPPPVAGNTATGILPPPPLPPVAGNTATGILPPPPPPPVAGNTATGILPPPPVAGNMAAGVLPQPPVVKKTYKPAVPKTINTVLQTPKSKVLELSKMSFSKLRSSILEQKAFRENPEIPPLEDSRAKLIMKVWSEATWLSRIEDIRKKTRFEKQEKLVNGEKKEEGVITIDLTGIDIKRLDTATYFGEGVDIVKLTDKIRSIGAYCFALSPLKEITLSKNLVSLGDSVFESCKDLKNIELPCTIMEIGKAAFRNSGLETVLFKKDDRSSSLKKKHEGCQELLEMMFSGEVSFDNTKGGLKVLKENTFENCTKLTTIELPEFIQKISSECFKDCEELKRISFPDSLKQIDEKAFYGCKKLILIEFNNANVNIGKSCFDRCGSLKSIKVCGKLYQKGDSDWDRTNWVRKTLKDIVEEQKNIKK